MWTTMARRGGPDEKKNRGHHRFLSLKKGIPRERGSPQLKDGHSTEHKKKGRGPFEKRKGKNRRKTGPLPIPAWKMFNTYFKEEKKKGQMEQKATCHNKIGTAIHQKGHERPEKP